MQKTTYLYNRCYELVNTRESPAVANETLPEVTLVPLSLPQGFSTIPHTLRHMKYSHIKNACYKVYYISDIHLAHHVMEKYPRGANDQQVIDYIQKLADSLFGGEFAEDITSFESPIVLFGGDISSCFCLSEVFFHEFVSKWNAVETKAYKKKLSELRQQASAIRKGLNTSQEIVEAYKNSHEWTKNAKKSLTEYKKVPDIIKEALARMQHLQWELNDILGSIESHKKYHAPGRSKHIYSILGNHEFWDFGTYEECVTAYLELFSGLNIHFLNTNADWLVKCSVPTVPVRDENTKEWHNRLISREEDPAYYDNQMLYANNCLILGGVGFAANNPNFNAAQGIYGAAIDVDKEKALSDQWLAAVKETSEIAEENHSVLVILSHSPVSDWLDDSAVPANCVVFHGHTHRNTTYGDERNSFVIADNQIGYQRKSISLKSVILYKPRNPFALSPDGLKEISLMEYKEYYRFMSEKIPTTKLISKQINEFGGKLFLIKEQEYCGFFLSVAGKTYICNGGKTQLINSMSIDDISKCFIFMVAAFREALDPLRKLMEEMSNWIKSFGGDGTIHGTIVDIDFYNHVMFNTEDGKITYYNSDSFGRVIPYPNMYTLLHEKCRELEKNLPDSLCADSISFSNPPQFEEIVVDIKNSQYKHSRYINALQRLFDKCILRVWNTDLLLSLFERHFTLTSPRTNNQLSEDSAH